MEPIRAEFAQQASADPAPATALDEQLWWRLAESLEVSAAPAPATALDEQLWWRLSESLEAGGERRRLALAALHGRVGALSFDAAGCRLVQQAFEVADRASAGEMLAELSGRVREAARSPYANYVVQKIIGFGNSAQVDSVAGELLGAGVVLARHCYGCRILCRLAEHGGPRDAKVALLLDEVLEHAEQLCIDPFGHHVLQSVVEHGNARQRSTVVEALLRGNLAQRASDWQASHVVVSALTYCSKDEVRAMGAKILDCGPDGIAVLARNRFGVGALRILARVPGDTSCDCLRALWAAAPQLWSSRYGRVLLREVGIVPVELAGEGAEGQAASVGASGVAISGKGAPGAPGGRRTGARGRARGAGRGSRGGA